MSLSRVNRLRATTPLWLLSALLGAPSLAFNCFSGENKKTNARKPMAFELHLQKQQTKKRKKKKNSKISKIQN